MTRCSVKSSRFLQNAIENVFSVLDSFGTKPSAVRFTHNLRAFSVTQFTSDPIKGSYMWDENEASGRECFLKLLAKDTTSHAEELAEDVVELQVDFHVPEQVSTDDFFKTSIEINSFFFAISHLLQQTLKSIKCQNCISVMVTRCLDENEMNKLKRMRNDYSSEPTKEVLDTSYNSSTFSS